MLKSARPFIAKFIPPVLLLLGTFALSSKFDLFESFTDFSSRHEDLQLDEIIIVFVSLALYFMVLSFRQARILKQRNRVINDSLIEKTLLLKENYHRQKNNLNIIISLIEMEDSSFNTPETREPYQKILSRLNSMGVLYEKLQNTNDANLISAGQYFTLLFDRMNQLYERKNVKVLLDIEDFQICPGQLTPLGIMINELYTNSIKYAFEDQAQGEIRFSLSRNINIVTSRFSDNGKGLSKTINETDGSGFGKKLLEALAKQLRAKMEIIEKNGTMFVITFTLKQKPRPLKTQISFGTD